MKQWLFNFIVITAVAGIVALVLWLVPEARAMSMLVWKVILVLLNFLIFIGIWVLILLIPMIAAFSIRYGIDAVDESINGNTGMNGWLHVLVCVALGFAVSVAWIYGIRGLVSLPTWVNLIYKQDVNGFTNLMEVIPWGWAIYSFISFTFGYSFGNKENSENLAIWSSDF